MTAPNPFPHIADDLWRTMRVSPYATQDTEPFPDELVPRLRIVTEGDRRRAPVGQAPTAAPVPPEGDLSEIMLRFRADRAAGCFLEYPTWPVCCRRPSTLIGADRSFSAIASYDLEEDTLPHYLEAELREDWGMDEANAERAIRKLDDPEAPEPIAPPRGWRRLFADWKPWLDSYDQICRGARDGSDGTAVFQCRACGRYYLGLHHVP